MIRMPYPTKLYDIRKQLGKEGYNSFCNGTIFAPRDMKIIGCGTGKEECVPMTEEEKKCNRHHYIKWIVIIRL